MARLTVAHAPPAPWWALWRRLRWWLGARGREERRRYYNGVNGFFELERLRRLHRGWFQVPGGGPFDLAPALGDPRDGDPCAWFRPAHPHRIEDQ